MLGASRATEPVGAVGLKSWVLARRGQRALSRGGPGSGAAGRVRQGRKGGILQEVDSQASACSHCQILPASLLDSLPLSLEDRSGLEFLRWGWDAVSRKNQILEGRPNTSKLPSTGLFLSRICPPPQENQWPREGHGDPGEPWSGGAPQGLAGMGGWGKAARPKVLPPRGSLHPSLPFFPAPLKESSAFPSPLFPPHLDPPLSFSPRLHSAPLQCPSPPLLFGRPPRQSPPPRAPARPSAPPRLLERLRLPSRAALRLTQSRAICQRSRPGGASRPAGARVTSD